MLPQHEYTRWRELANPLSPLDPIQPDGPKYEPGKLPLRFIMLLWNGTVLFLPKAFQTQEQADAFAVENGITHYLIVPKPC